MSLRYKPKGEPPKLLELAANIANAKDRDVPQLLLRLQELLDRVQPGSLAVQELKAQILELDLLDVLLLTVQQDPSKVQGTWATLTQLINILCVCCVGIDPKDEDFSRVFLPAVSDTILNIACKMQAKYAKTASVLSEARKKFLDQMVTIISGLTSLFGSYTTLTSQVVQSPLMQELLMREEGETAPIAISILQSACRVNSRLMQELDEENQQSILDELVYKLTSGGSSSVAAAATRALNLICDIHPPCVTQLCRYKGLRTVLQQWQDTGFQRELQRLISILECGNAAELRKLKLDAAATRIQAVWKSFYTRKRLKRAEKAFTVFQRSYRKRKENEETKKAQHLATTELQHLTLMRRRKSMRQLHQKRLNALQILPAHLVERHLKAEQYEAASKIQACWRGYNARKGFQSVMMASQKSGAAVRIQRQYRRHLNKKHAAKKEPPGWQRPPGLTDERRVELMGEVNEWRENHAVKTQGEDKRKELHGNVQNLLRAHAIASKVTRQRQQQREVLLARLELDAGLLTDKVNLQEVTEKDVAAYQCNSLHIATKARYNHNQELRLLRQPWWKKLGDEYQDEKLDEELNWKQF